MTPSAETRHAADARHWRGIRRTALVLALLWLVVGFAPAFFARELQFTVFGVPFGVWMAAQGAPIVFVLLVWAYDLRASRLDRDHRDALDGDDR
jgi:putative solute:sodium symporter small subunit